MAVLSRRLVGIGGAKNAVLRKLSAELASKGLRISDLTRGELDRAPPSVFLDAAAAALTCRTNGYTDSIGLEALRQDLSVLATHKWKIPFQCENVAVTSGAKPALFLVMLAILEPGDEVVIPRPHWTTFSEQVRLAGGTPVFADVANAGYDLSGENVAALITSRTKAILLNRLNNPTGRVLNGDELSAIVRLAQEKDVFLILDECCCDLIYAGADFEEVGESDHIVIVDTFSKTWALTGWRIGFVCGAKRIINAIALLQTHTTSNPSSIAQHSVLRALRQGGADEFVVGVRNDLRRRRDWLQRQFEGLKSIAVLRPEGGFFAYVDLRGIADRRAADVDLLCAEMLVETGVLVVPGTAFGDSGGFRLSFGGDVAEMRHAVGSLVAFLRRAEARA